MIDLTTLEKVGKFANLDNLVRVYNHKKGLHIVVLYLVLGNWRIPWSFRIYRGKRDSLSFSISFKIAQYITFNFNGPISDLCLG